jgi:two-component system nitrogen regulation sensor histidine kinase NtrY
MISNTIHIIRSGLTDFRINILARLALILCTQLLLVLIYQNKDPLVFSFIGGMLILSVQVYWLFSYMQSTQLEMESFFEALRHGDSARRVQTRFKQSQKLKMQWQEIQSQLQQLRQKNEELMRYYSLMLEKVPVALVVVEGEKIELVNSAAQQLFKQSSPLPMQQLLRYGSDLARDIQQITSGEQRSSQLVTDQVITVVALSAATIQLHSGSKKVVSIQPIQRELDKQEISAWQNLVQVFTHEIMNSMTPVTSLSKTADSLLLTHLARHADTEPNADESLQDAQQAIHTVARRAEHLMHFVQAYRRIANPPPLQTATLVIADLLETVSLLFRSQASERNIKISCSVEPTNLTLLADPVQLEQILINLLMNSMDALTGKSAGHIDMKSYIGQAGNLLIDIIDNGTGIPAERREQIFVPFYTSKQDGTGVGLFLVKQMMQAHGGSVSALQNTSGETILRLMF